MHPRFHERRGRVVSALLNEVDLEIRNASKSIGRRVRLAGSLCMGNEEADALQDLLRAGIDCVLGIPGTSESGRRSRRELIAKLIELDDYLNGLLHSIETAAKLVDGGRHGLDRSLRDLDHIADTGDRAAPRRSPA